MLTPIGGDYKGRLKVTQEAYEILARHLLREGAWSEALAICSTNLNEVTIIDFNYHFIPEADWPWTHAHTLTIATIEKAISEIEKLAESADWYEMVGDDAETLRKVFFAFLQHFKFIEANDLKTRITVSQFALTVGLRSSVVRKLLVSLEAHGLIQILSPLKGRRVITCGLGERVRERLFENMPRGDEKAHPLIDELIALAASADWKAIGGRSQANDRKVFACLLEAH